MKENRNITIVGGGVVGLSIAHALSTRFQGEINLLEKNDKIADDNQSTRNSGVIHAGIYYDRKIVPKKAALCVEGNHKLYAFCGRYRVAHKKVGKLVVATDQRELAYLEDTYRIARENNVPDIRMVDSNFVKKQEPNVQCLAALYCPSSGVIEPVSYIKKLHGLVKNNKVCVYLKSQVADIRSRGDRFTVTIQSGNQRETIDTDCIINCAGLYSDTIARLVNPDSPYEIIPVKGEAVKFLKTEDPGLFTSGMNIYPSPQGIYADTGEKAVLPFSEFLPLYRKGVIKKTLGVHLTPLVYKGEKAGCHLSDEVTVGPALGSHGLKDDYSHTFDRAHYVQGIHSFFPNISAEHLAFHQTGILAMAKGHPDFVIERDLRHENFINLIGIDSPGLTSSLAIGRHVSEIVETLG